MSGPATITSASTTELADYNFLQSINWAFYQANGAGGLPGTKLASGSSSLSSAIVGFDDFGDAVVQDGFSVGNVALGSGSYYFAVQGVSADPTLVDNYLAQGVQSGGAAETMDGGRTWVETYANDPRSGYISSIAVSLAGVTSTVPEPSSWAMIIVGLGLIGSLVRRRNTIENHRVPA